MDSVFSFFINREKELKIIGEAIETLQGEKNLLQTPIIEFSGVQGIGKTSLLQQIKIICDTKNLHCIIYNAEGVTPDDFAQIESLIVQKPVTIILDSLDMVNTDQLQIIETELSELIENSRLFVLLGSRDIRKFERKRSIARKLKIMTLEPFSQQSCLSYLDHFTQVISSDSRDIILDWTHGYPLAMDVMTRTIVDKQLDLTKEEDQKQLMIALRKEVIEENLLVTARSDDRIRLQSLLALLSVPRRFNLVLAQDLIEKYAKFEYKLENSLAYITLPKAINEVTSVLSWNLEWAGYRIDTPIRHLFLLQYKVEHPQDLITIHTFLAQKNEQFAREVSGSDHIRYLREFFYHFASSEDEAKVRESLTQQIEQLAQVQIQELQSYQDFVQFYEEFQQDQELKEVLGKKNSSFALNLMYKNFLAIYKQSPQNEGGDWLINFFSLVAQQPQNKDFVLIFEEGMRQIFKQATREDAMTLYDELIQYDELKSLLGVNFDVVSQRLRNELLINEG